MHKSRCQSLSCQATRTTLLIERSGGTNHRAAHIEGCGGQTALALTHGAAGSLQRLPQTHNTRTHLRSVPMTPLVGFRSAKSLAQTPVPVPMSRT